MYMNFVITSFGLRPRSIYDLLFSILMQFDICREVMFLSLYFLLALLILLKRLTLRVSNYQPYLNQRRIAPLYSFGDTVYQRLTLDAFFSRCLDKNFIGPLRMLKLYQTEWFLTRMVILYHLRVCFLLMAFSTVPVFLIFLA